MLLLASFTALERVTFKIIVDEMTPYRYFFVLLLLLFSAAIFNIVSVVKRAITVRR